MRVAVVHSFYTRKQPSGENSVVLDQVEQLRRAGHDVQLISRDTDDFSHRRGYAMRSALTTVTGVGSSPEQELESFDPDIVHVHNTFPNWGVNWTDRWASRMVLTLHNYRTICANGLLFRDGHECFDCVTTPVVPAVRHRCYRGSRLASLPVAMGAAPRGGLRRLPLASARLVVLNETAGTRFSNVFDRDVDVVPNFVAPVAKPEHPSMGWIFVGRLSTEKGIDKLLTEWPVSEPLDIVGGGPLEGVVRALADTLPHVRVLGLKSRGEVLEMLPRYTGLVLPSACSESLPTVILEALSCGLPSVLSSHVEAAESVRAAGAAAVFDLGDGSISSALAAVRSRGASMRAESLEVFARHYSPSAWQASIDRIYGEVVDERMKSTH